MADLYSLSLCELLLPRDQSYLTMWFGNMVSIFTGLTGPEIAGRGVLVGKMDCDKPNMVGERKEVAMMVRGSNFQAVKGVTSVCSLTLYKSD